jgi:cobalt/nickel transport system permease protein
MHIPDGYLGPPTYGALWALMVPIWAWAGRMVRKVLSARRLPYLALGAAFSFIIMMFNVPIPGGTTGHAVGGTLVAVLVGPWAACLAVSLALVVQALLFGDGGITALGANCFNMAFVLPLTGYLVYRAISTGAEPNSRRHWLGAGIGSYLGINIGALLAGLEFGIQPLLHHLSNGQALYCPYPLKIALPAMLGEHLLLFGWVEAVVTALVVVYLQKADPALFQKGGPR